MQSRIKTDDLVKKREAIVREQLIINQDEESEEKGKNTKEKEEFQLKD